jgi:predicted phage terminase large subunit-like protein
MADESAICVAGISTRNPETVYIRDIIKGKWGFPDLIEAVKQQFTFYRAKMLCIEKAASGHSLIQVLKKETKIPIEEMRPLKSKTVRMQAVCPLFENSRIRIVRGMWTDNFIKELTAFPYVRHDDSVDAMVWALTYYSLKLDSVDRGLQQAIIQSKKWRGDYRRPDASYTNGVSAARVSPRRMLGDDSFVNDPDYGSQTSSDGGSFFRHNSRRGLGYDPLF